LLFRRFTTFTNVDAVTAWSGRIKTDPLLGLNSLSSQTLAYIKLSNSLNTYAEIVLLSAEPLYLFIHPH
jgi:hypothetical protein